MPFSREFHEAAGAIRPDNAHAGYQEDADHPVNRLVRAVRNDDALRAALTFPELQNKDEADATEAFLWLQGGPGAGYWNEPTYLGSSRKILTAEDIAGILASSNDNGRHALREADRSAKPDTVVTGVALLVAAALDDRCRARLGNPSTFFSKLMGGQDVRLERFRGFGFHFGALNGKSLNASGGGNHRLLAASAFNRFALGAGSRLGAMPIDRFRDGAVSEVSHDGGMIDRFFDGYAIIAPHGGSLVRWTPRGPRGGNCAGEALRNLTPEEGLEKSGGAFLVNKRRLEDAAYALRPKSPFGRLTETWPVIGDPERKARRGLLEFVRGQL